MRYGQKFILKHIYSQYYLTLVRNELSEELMSFKLIINEEDSLRSIFQFETDTFGNLNNDLVYYNKKIVMQSTYEPSLYLSIQNYKNYNQFNMNNEVFIDLNMSKNKSLIKLHPYSSF